MNNMSEPSANNTPTPASGPPADNTPTLAGAPLANNTPTPAAAPPANNTPTPAGALPINNTPTPAPATGVLLPAGPAPSWAQQKAAREKREYSTPERVLILLAYAISVPLVWMCTTGAQYEFYLAVFWLCYLAVFYLFNQQKLRGKRTLHMVALFSAALCVWNFIYDYRSTYGALTALVIPGVLMAHAVVLHGGRELKQVADIVADWLAGWALKPFTAIPMLFGAGASALDPKKAGSAKKVLLAVGISVPLLLVIVPLLCSADMVFNHYLSTLLADIDLYLLIYRLLFSAVVCMFLYSFLWNIRFSEPGKVVARKEVRLDVMISAIVLGIILAVYLLFCLVQFTHLFVQAGLPVGMTYSEYAREGFWQLIVVAGINLLLFGVVLQYAKESRLLPAMLLVLLAETAVLLVSAALRLRLYIDSYGLTWLRLLSGWFILYLAVVLALCGARMRLAKMPLIAVCAFVLLGWYTVLGYLNPDALIMRYNLRTAEHPAAWVEENRSYVRGLSNNAWLVVLEREDVLVPEVLTSNSALRNAENGLSHASRRTQQLLLLELEQQEADAGVGQQ